ncbi:hypothetical protein SDC9_145838 [bioreactor metagenome]|uniref:Uncharacterized protein n=1 Tax=bioreactor metagenome TaxID=1076179 RepID=A0A645EA29_9ZZZZ
MVALNRDIIGDCQYWLVVLMDKNQLAIDHFSPDIPFIFHNNRLIGLGDFKRITVFQPVVCNLNLFTVDDLLFKQTKFIADSISVPGKAHGSG